MSRFIKPVSIFMLFCLVLGLACKEAAPKSSSVSLTDDLGRTVTVKGVPKRIVSLAPSNTEILFALDLGDKVVGVTENCDYPEEAKAKPKVGGYFTANLEAILAKNPDLILTDGHDPVGQKLEDLGIPMLVLQPKDISGIFRDIEVVGKVTNKEKEGAKLVASLQKRLNTVADKTAQISKRPTVFYEIDATDPAKPWTAGPGSFADILISLAGGKNVVKAPGAWLQFSLEELVSADPDIIVLGDYPYVKPEQVGERGGVWQKLTAVKSGSVYAISDPSLTSRPGPRIIEGLEEFAKIIHPELFP